MGDMRSTCPSENDLPTRSRCLRNGVRLIAALEGANEFIQVIRCKPPPNSIIPEQNGGLATPRVGIKLRIRGAFSRSE
jgi:hypothetical protein